MAVSFVPSSFVITRFKFEVDLIGSKTGTNLIFTTPDTFLQETIRLYLNGQRLKRGAGDDYLTSESGGSGTGFDTITLAAGLAPEAIDNLFADYITELS